MWARKGGGQTRVVFRNVKGIPDEGERVEVWFGRSSLAAQKGGAWLQRELWQRKGSSLPAFYPLFLSLFSFSLSSPLASFFLILLL